MPHNDEIKTQLFLVFLIRITAIKKDTRPPEADIKNAVTPLVKNTNTDFESTMKNADFTPIISSAKSTKRFEIPSFTPIGKGGSSIFSINARTHASALKIAVFVISLIFLSANYNIPLYITIRDDCNGYLVRNAYNRTVSA